MVAVGEVQSTVIATPPQDNKVNLQLPVEEGVDTGGEGEEYLEGFPTVWKALKQLFKDIVWWLCMMDIQLGRDYSNMMREAVAELGMANAEMIQLTWNTTVQIIPMMLRELTCHFRSTEVDIAVPPFE